MVSGDASSVLALVERAKERLVQAVPSPRGVQAVSLADALSGFERELGLADELLSRTRENGGLRSALAESLARAERLRLEAPPLDYEGLVGVLGELMDPLEAFGGR